MYIYIYIYTCYTYYTYISFLYYFAAEGIDVNYHYIIKYTKKFLQQNSMDILLLGEWRQKNVFLGLTCFISVVPVINSARVSTYVNSSPLFNRQRPL